MLNTTTSGPATDSLQNNVSSTESLDQFPQSQSRLMPSLHRDRVGFCRLTGYSCGTLWLVGALLLAGCGGSTSEPSGPTGAESPSIVPPGEVPPPDESPAMPAPESSPPAAGTESPDVSATSPFVLPPDFDPAQAPAQPADGEAPRSGGFELPPVNDSSAIPADAGGVRLVAAPQAPATATSAADKAAEVVLKTAGWETITQAVAKTDRVTVVDLWSLACEPCLKEFPGLVQIDRELGKRVACLAVNVDFDGRRTKPAESYRPRVEAFLASVGAKFPNYLCDTASDEVFTAVEIDSIPAVMIYDASGKLVRTFSDVGEDAGFTYEKNIIPLVKRLLEEGT
ncbi:MAG: TlpA family protein disulfide reductase [Planctomycetaceae bacterium]|nr:MAG: TlpA family protein disulfide reductase [Planctomycetaceae bacterium]